MGIRKDSVIQIVETYYCDRCGKIGEACSRPYHQLTNVYIENHPQKSGLSTNYKVCQSCWIEVLDLLKGFMTHA